MHRQGDGIIRQFAAQFLFHFPNHRVTLLGAFGKPFQYRITHALDFKAVFRRTNAVADLLDALRQFIAINRRAVTNRVIHSARL